MASFGKHFAIDLQKGKSKQEAILKGNFYRITILTERLIRLEYSKDGNFNDSLTDLVENRDFDVPAFNVEQDEKYLVITTKYFNLQYQKDKPFKAPSFAPDTNLRVKLLNTDKIWYYGHPEARNFKATAGSLDDFKGTKKLNKGLYSTDGFVSIEDKKPLSYSEIGILQDNNEENENVDIYLFMYRRDFGLCLKDYFNLTGYPSLIPKYALGIWWHRDKIYSFDDTKKLVNAFEYHNIPLNVLLLGEFWHIKDEQNINLYKTGFTFNNNLFPQPSEFTNYMHNHKVFVGLSIDPSEGIRKEEPAYKHFAPEINHQENQNIPFRAFDKMFTILYFETIINELNKFDIDFYFLDFKPSKSLEAYTNYHMRDFLKTEEKRPLVMARNSEVSAHKKGILYSGETIVSWNTLKYLPYFSSSSANLGISFWSHDIGGYKNGTEDSELYMRYCQFGCFSPIFRLSAKRGIYYKREPWSWDFKTYNIVKEYTNLRQKLIPYIYSECYKYHHEGLPLISPLYYDNPEIYDELDYKNEYYFGSSMLICPITTPKDKVMDRVALKIYLPKGTWYDFKTGRKYSKTKRYILFYKDEDYPVFVREGAIIPMANTQNDLNLISSPKKMDVQVFPGKSNTYILYEDDGTTRLHEKGYFVKTAIDYNYMEGDYSVIIRPIEGKTNIIPETRDYKIIFRNTKEANKVEALINNVIVNDLKFKSYESGNDFIVEVKDVDTTKQLTVKCNGKNIDFNSNNIFYEDINSIINDLMITTNLKEDLAKICFSNMKVSKKRIAIKKLKSKGLNTEFIKMFMKLYDFIDDN